MCQRLTRKPTHKNNSLTIEELNSEHRDLVNNFAAYTKKYLKLNNEPLE